MKSILLDSPSAAGLVITSLATLLLGCSAQRLPELPPPGPGMEVEATGATPFSFVAISDVHLDDGATATCRMVEHDGHESCEIDDTGEDLWGSAKTRLQTVLQSKTQKPAFVLYLGDLPQHDSGDLHGDMKQVLGDLRTIAQGAGVPLLYLPGNNDSLAGDYCPFTTSDHGAPATPLDLDGGQSAGWPMIGGRGACDATASNKPCILEQDPTWGYFSAYPKAGSNLRVVALNTALISTDTRCDGMLDLAQRAKVAGDQFDFLERQMEQAKSQDRVLVAMHVPPGLDGYSGHPSWRSLTLPDGSLPRDRFLAILREHRSITVGTLTAHSHMEEIRRLYGKDDQGTCDSSFFGVALSIPGITPPHGNNPAFKVFDYDGQGTLENFEMHYRPQQGGCCTWGDWDSYSFQDVTHCTGASISACVSSLGTSGLDEYENTNGYYAVLSGRSTLQHPSMYDVRPTGCGG